MRISLAVILAVSATVALGLTGVVEAQQQRWAAVDPNREVSGPVAWGSTEMLAKQRAVEACEKVSKTCANGPATTNDMEDVFAVMCCTRPKLGCAVAAAESRDDASASVRKNLTEAGYSSCQLRHYMSAGSGKKQ
jgi:hypothetical protein